MNISNRPTIIQQLENEQFDVVVIGGGVTGAWIALQCSSLGYKTAICERGDFAGGTSSASSKLLHGGIRYLQQLQLNKLRESSLERAEYIYAAPHLCTSVPFVVPTYKDLKRSKFILYCGILTYRLLGLGQNKVIANAELAKKNGETQHFSATELNKLCDLSHINHTGAIAFTETHMHDSERTVWSIIESAIKHGAIAANYTSITEIVSENEKTKGVNVKDNETGREFFVKSNIVINAAGPWVDDLNQQVGNPDKANGTAQLIHNFAAGAHLVTRQLTSKHAIAITTKQKSVTTLDRGGRHIFIIPWRGFSLIGTSYRETKDPNGAENLGKEDLSQLLEAVNEMLPAAQLGPEDIKSAYVGLYPLRTNTQLKSTYQGSGEYILIDHQQEYGIEGLITSLGAKFTTGRILAEKTVRLVQKKLVAPITYTSSSTQQRKKNFRIRLCSSNYKNLEQFTDNKISSLRHRLPAETIRHLINCYGSHLDDFIEYLDANENSELLLTAVVQGLPDILGQVSWAIDKEMAIRLDDVLLRRTSVGHLGISSKEIEIVATLMQEKLDWTDQHTKAQIANAVSRQVKIHEVTEEFYRE